MILVNRKYKNENEEFKNEKQLKEYNLNQDKEKNSDFLKNKIIIKMIRNDNAKLWKQCGW